jgi:oligosaccharide reducing-end xylanase
LPAPDGEEYWVTALYFPAGRWGGGEGVYDYRSEADRLVDCMKNRKIIDGTR